MGMDSAQSFYFFEQKANGTKAQAILVSSILQWKLLCGTLITILIITVAPLLNRWFFGGKLSVTFFCVVFFGVLFTQILSQGIEIFRLLYRPWPYILTTLAQTLLNVSFALFFIILLQQGVLGFFAGSALSSLLLACWTWLHLHEYTDFSFLHKNWWPRLLKFGIPLIPGSFAFFLMSTADRWFIQHYHDATALGLYAVTAKFAFLMSLFIATFRQAWWPIAMDSMHSEDGPETFRMIARLFMGIGVAGIVALTFIVPILMRLLVPPVYYSSWRVAGVIAWQPLFFGFYLIGTAGIWKAEKTWIASLLMIASTLLNLLLNYLLVPPFAGFGAALATAITFFLWVFSSMLISERLWYVGFNLPVFLLQIITGGLIVWWLTFNERRSLFELAATLLTCAFFLATAFENQDWERFKKRIASRKSSGKR